jgi:hypothetical protein
MNHSLANLVRDTEQHSLVFDDDFPEALECWSLQDFLDILGGQLP